MTIYTDDGALTGNRTRLFRDGRLGGVEWTYAVDFAGSGDRTRWYAFDRSLAEPSLDCSAPGCGCEL